jgi:methionyl-tRNA formyltransferase
MHKKRILFLGYSESETPIVSFLKDYGYEVEVFNGKVSDLSEFELVVSFGYKHILTKATLSTANRDPINLHVSFLPFNRGMHPNFWSHYENTPSGVTIHHIDSGLDTGDIIVQKRISFSSNETTFRQTWSRLKIEIEELFISQFPLIIANDYLATKQENEGTFHMGNELPEQFAGWDSDINTEIDRLKKTSSG